MSSELPSACRPRLAPQARLKPDPTSGQTALLAPESVLLLNETSSAILALCDGRTLEEIVAALAVRFGASREDLLRDTASYLSRLRDRGLVQV